MAVKERANLPGKPQRLWNKISKYKYEGVIMKVSQHWWVEKIEELTKILSLHQRTNLIPNSSPFSPTLLGITGV